MIKPKNSDLTAKKIVIACLFTVIIAFLLFVAVLQLFFPHKVVEFVGFQLYSISYTGSMEPILNFHDLILVKRFDFNELHKGDIISFVATTLDGREIVVTHEVNEIYFDPIDGTKYIETKGVNLPLADTIAVTQDGVHNTNVYLGKYVGKSEFLGNFLAYLTSLPGIFAIVVNMACLTAIFSVLPQKGTGAFVR